MSEEQEIEQEVGEYKQLPIEEETQDFGSQVIDMDYLNDAFTFPEINFNL